MVKGRKPTSEESEEENNRPAESDSEREVASETEEEYEIEDILEAKHGAFPGVSRTESLRVPCSSKRVLRVKWAILSNGRTMTNNIIAGSPRPTQGTCHVTLTVHQSSHSLSVAEMHRLSSMNSGENSLRARRAGANQT